MKTLLVLVLLVATLPATAADTFYDVVGKTCDGSKVKPASGERMFVGMGGNIMGFGQTDEKGCQVYNFYMMAIQSFTVDNVVAIVQSSAGKRSSCVEGVLPGDPADFAAVDFRGNKAILMSNTDCQVIELELREVKD